MKSGFFSFLTSFFSGFSTAATFSSALMISSSVVTASSTSSVFVDSSSTLTSSSSGDISLVSTKFSFWGKNNWFQTCSPVKRNCGFIEILIEFHFKSFRISL
jgi:hypothetical protein